MVANVWSGIIIEIVEPIARDTKTSLIAHLF